MGVITWIVLGLIARKLAGIARQDQDRALRPDEARPAPPSRVRAG